MPQKVLKACENKAEALAVGDQLHHGAPILLLLHRGVVEEDPFPHQKGSKRGHQQLPGVVDRAFVDVYCVLYYILCIQLLYLYSAVMYTCISSGIYSRLVSGAWDTRRAPHSAPPQ